MKLHFLGTAAAEGFPNVYCKCDTCEKARQSGGRNIRTRCSVIIDDVLKVDQPPDSFTQALRDGIDMSLVRDLLITHTHYDHLNAGELISRMKGYAHGVEHPLNIYGNDLALFQCRQALLEEHEGEKQFYMRRLQPFKQIKVGDAKVTPLLADHDQRETCLIYFLEKDNMNVLYGNDSGWFPDETWEWLKGKKVDFAILDCTVGKNGNKHSGNHMSVESVIEVQNVFREGNLLKDHTKLVVTHFSHNCGLLHEDLVEIFKPYGIEVAYDGMVVNI
ncbi:MBL fold metallo-hydrolase [Pseudalkalibacillus decolorationis]|uniref:MBL fold metallo-hydrolase n=1 Tax=Pseudalkalibacillus decolorationis TaxID=163879 RepID=UPI002147D0D1|nr:MBL fold metallo-hydrolase [Pseudalkalibacillus decolorationis]